MGLPNKVLQLCLPLKGKVGLPSLAPGHGHVLVSEFGTPRSAYREAQPPGVC